MADDAPETHGLSDHSRQTITEAMTITNGAVDGPMMPGGVTEKF